MFHSNQNMEQYYSRYSFSLLLLKYLQFWVIIISCRAGSKDVPQSNQWILFLQEPRLA